MRHLSDADAEFVDSVPEPSPTPAETTLSRHARAAARARRRTERIAMRKGLAPQGDPRLHVHLTGRFSVGGNIRGAEDVLRTRRRIRVGTWIVIALVALLCMGAVAYGTWSAELWGGRTVPDVRGLTATEASSRLVGEGFSVNQVERADDSKVGLVVDMDPKPGTRQDTRTSITLYVGVASQNPSSPGGSDGQGS